MTEDLELCISSIIEINKHEIAVLKVARAMMRIMPDRTEEKVKELEDNIKKIEEETVAYEDVLKRI